MTQSPPPAPDAPPPRLVAARGALLIVDKPSGWLVHNSAWAGPKEATLVDWLRTGHPGAVPLHRLDRGASGLVAFAADKTAAAALGEQLEHAEKRYLALCRGRLKAPVDLSHPLVIDGTEKPARTAFSLLAHCPDPRVCLVEAQLFSGRRHQIRRHAKHLSHPLVGDVKYGKGPLNRAFREGYGLHRLALHAHQLTWPDGTRDRAPLSGALAETVTALFGDGVLAF